MCYTFEQKEIVKWISPSPTPSPPPHVSNQIQVFSILISMTQFSFRQNDSISRLNPAQSVREKMLMKEEEKNAQFFWCCVPFVTPSIECIYILIHIICIHTLTRTERVSVSIASYPNPLCVSVRERAVSNVFVCSSGCTRYICIVSSMVYAMSKNLRRRARTTKYLLAVPSHIPRVKSVQTYLPRQCRYAALCANMLMSKIRACLCVCVPACACAFVCNAA